MACQKLKSNLIRLELMAQGFKMQKLIDEYKTITLGKRGEHWNPSKTFSLYLSFLWNGFEACQKPKSNLIRLEIVAQAFKMEKLVDEYKSFFWESEENYETLQKSSPYIWVSYKMVLKPVKSLNRIL